MKLKIILLALCLLALGSVSFAQKKKTTTAAATPDLVVKKLYSVHNTDNGPFHQTKKRALIDTYFVKELADMIWKDAVEAKGEVGAIDFDPLSGTQEEITGLVIGKPRDAGGPDNAFVKATFKVAGKAYWVDYELQREAGKWKIVDIYYFDGEDLASILRYSQDSEFKKEFDENQTFIGDYLIGNNKCSAMPTLNSMKIRVQCEGEEDFKLYQIEGTETETAFINIDEKGVEKGRFVFKNGEINGKYIDGKGKTMKVSRVN